MAVPSPSPDRGEAGASLTILERLATAARSISSRLDLAAVLRELVAAATDLAGARYGAVGVFAEDGHTLSEFITVGLSDEEIAAIGTLPTGRGVLGTLVHHPDPLRVADITKHPDSVGFPPRHPRMRSFLGVPIRVGSEVFGRIYLADKIGDCEFTDDDEGLVTLIAAQAAVAVENARLFEQARQRVRELEALNDVSMALAGQDDPAGVLRSVARAGRALGGGGAAVVVVPDGDALRIAAADGRPQAEVWRLFRAARQVASEELAAVKPVATPRVHTADGCVFAAAPLVAGPRVLGVLAVGLRDPELPPVRRRSLGTVASLAASSLRLAAEYQSSVAAERRQRALFEVARVALGGGPLHEIVTAACERVLVLSRAAAVVILWGDEGEGFEVVAFAGDLDASGSLRGPDDLPGYEWVPVPSEEGSHGWLGVRLAPGDHLTPDRRERLEGWAGVISLAYRAERLRAMRRQVLVAEERSRIAMELHDGAVQRLFGVGMALQGAALMAGDGNPRVAAAVASAVDEIDSAITEIRAYVHGLRPSGLGAETVRQLIADDVAVLSAAGIDTSLHLDDATLGALTGDASAELVQVVAEACANMARHAHATEAQIRLSRHHNTAILTITDNGVGFDPTTRPPGHGLRNLRERAARLDATFHLDSAPGKGTRLRLEIPL
jgi:signal transduction histidine kinase